MCSTVTYKRKQKIDQSNTSNGSRSSYVTNARHRADSLTKIVYPPDTILWISNYINPFLCMINVFNHIEITSFVDVIIYPYPCDTVYPKKYAKVFALLCFFVVIHWLIFPYPSGLLHWHCGNLTIAPVPAKQPWWIWINTSGEFNMNDCITTTKLSTTKPCAYFLGYTVV